ncbi:MAG: DUF2164 domain-containing protein [Granulosicoccus sp.]
MTGVTFSKEEKQILIKKIQVYFSDELDQDLGQFPAEFLLDFFTEEVGPYFYNRGLFDAQAVLELRLETLAEAIYELEKPIEFDR